MTHRENNPPCRLKSNTTIICTFALLLLASKPLTASEDNFKKIVAPFLKQHCYACHGPEKQQSRLRLDRITGMQAGNRNLWTMVHERVAAGEMPPKKRPQPADAERKQVLTWIRNQQKALGASGTRRLNRRELAAALADVTGLEVDFSFGLPGDGKVAGFDTGADGLQEASDSVAVWLQVTRRAVEGIRFLEPARHKIFAADFRQWKDIRRDWDRAWKEHGARARPPRQPRGGRPGLGMFIEGRAVGERDGCRITIPPTPDREGVLRLTLVVSAMKPFPAIPNPHLWVKIGGKYIDYREITAPREKPATLVYEVQMGDLVVQSTGIEIELSNKVELPYAVKGFENEDRSRKDRPVPGGTGLFRPKYDRRELPPEKQPATHLIVQSIMIEPDVKIAWPPADWKAELGEIKTNVESAERLLGVWMKRAWRRPVSGEEQQRFVKLFEQLRRKRMSFDDALRATFQSVLLSGPFRYQASPAHPKMTLAQHAIAARLSFMLTGGPPDAELRRLAMAGDLRKPDVLDTQVDRLFADPRSDGFVRPFVMQWLEMEQPITIAQTDLQMQDFRFARYLKASMREETIAYIAKLFRDNRPARELIFSDWTMMNDALARHYGYKGIDGDDFRKVKLRADDPRGGGILGHAGIQSMLCWMGENWVIYRGAWTARHILDHPPPPPPLEVPELNPSDSENRGKTFRQLLIQHQKDTRCAVCHKNIDPIGFAYQNFDISGRWRDVEHERYKRDELDGRVAWLGVGKTRPVDATGRLPRGETFSSFAGFKDVVIKDYQTDLVRGIMKNLVVYATGRSPGIDDMMEIRRIMRDTRDEGYRLRDLVKALVRSRVFLDG